VAYHCIIDIAITKIEINDLSSFQHIVQRAVKQYLACPQRLFNALAFGNVDDQRKRKNFF
jgi:hypothetical protein